MYLLCEIHRPFLALGQFLKGPLTNGGRPADVVASIQIAYWNMFKNSLNTLTHRC